MSKITKLDKDTIEFEDDLENIHTLKKKGKEIEVSTKVKNSNPPKPEPESEPEPEPKRESGNIFDSFFSE